MRKIEQQMLATIKVKDSKNIGNTGVFYENQGNPYGPRSEIYLHGNHLGDYWHDSGEFDVDIRTLRDWPTVITKSRLRALGVNLTTKQGRVYIDGQAI